MAEWTARSHRPPSSATVRLFYCFLILANLLVAKVSGLKMLQVSVPPLKQIGQSARLVCLYDLEGNKLYSVKWFKEGKEFFRYVPGDWSTPIQIFSIEGVLVDKSQSDRNQVTLTQLTAASAGTYRCEVSGEAPSFETVFGNVEMKIEGVGNRRGMASRRGKNNSKEPMKYEAKDIDEDVPIGSPILKVEASDFVSRAEIKYSVSDDHFAVDSSGVISNAKQLDADNNKAYYEFNVTATVTTTVRVPIKNKNDEPPIFSQEVYTAKVGRNASSDTLVTTVEALDKDGDNVRYTFIGGAREIDQFVIEEWTGVIRLENSAINFDRDKYELILLARDDGAGSDRDGPLHTSTATLVVFIEDESPTTETYSKNEKSPFFTESDIETSVYENSKIGTSLATFRVSKDQVTFAIDRISDRRRQFAINQNGIVKIQRRLDREDVPRHHLKILAVTELTGLTATATLTVNVKDINDNGPRLLKDYRPVLMEHSPPRKVIEIEAIDDDDSSMGNGPPFHFRLDPKADDEILFSFKIQPDTKVANGTGKAILSSLRSFDREQQKEFRIPIVIKDSGKPVMSSTSTLTVVIGDINDNRMQVGSKQVLVYNYMGQAPDTEIGRINVNDADDWDLPDKKFYWENEPHPNFSLDQDTGMLTMRNTSIQGYVGPLGFRVEDLKNKDSVTAYVTVEVQKITHERVNNAGSIRISGITDLEFVKTWNYKTKEYVPSKLDKLQNKLAKLLAINSQSDIRIFSVQLRQRHPPITDIRFWAKASNSMKLNGLVLQHRDEIEAEVGINITMIGINECLIENKACHGSCTNVMKISPSPNLVDSNRTSLVGVRIDVQPECICGALNFTREESCGNISCSKGESCVEDENGFSCQSQDESDESSGPAKTTRSFLGDEWALYPALEMCEHSNLSIEFLAKKPDGILLYNGPMAAPKSGEISDFISLELESGNPRLLIDFGSGTLELKLNGTTLDDDNWHRIDVFWDTENVRMVLDSCRNVSDWDNETTCEVKGTMPPFSEYLDVNWPLQIGGVSHPPFDLSAFKWDHFPHFDKSFRGCIRNLVHNSNKIYDLGKPGMWQASKPSWFSLFVGSAADDICSGPSD